jgi:hypothetical protein
MRPIRVRPAPLARGAVKATSSDACKRREFDRRFVCRRDRWSVTVVTEPTVEDGGIWDVQAGFEDREHVPSVTDEDFARE